LALPHAVAALGVGALARSGASSLRSVSAGELVLEIGVDIGDVRRQNAADPGLAFVREDAQISDACDRIGWDRGAERSRVGARGEEHVMV